jgi:uncharacterized membrane protein YvbJ
MFCTKCGEQLNDNAKFCVKCGAAVEIKMPQQQQIPITQMQPNQNYAYQTNQTMPSTPKKPWSKLAKLILIEAILVIALGIFLNNNINKYTSPEFAAQQYFDAFMAGDAKSAANLVELSESEFVQKSNFETIVKKYYKKDSKVVKRALKKSNEDKKSGKITYEISYSLRDEDGDIDDFNSMNVTLVKTGKKYLFWDNWKIDMNTFVSDEITIETRCNSKVTIDGKELSDKYITKNDEDWDEREYTIPHMLEGTYSVTVSNDIYEDYSFTIDAEANDDATYYNRSTPYKKEVCENVMNTATKDFTTLWNGLSLHKELSELTLSSEQHSEADVDYDYGYMLNKIATDDSDGITKISMDSVNVSTTAGAGNTIEVKFTTTLNYTEITTGWFSGERTKEKKSSDYEAELTYIYEDGKWKLYRSNIYAYL